MKRLIVYFFVISSISISFVTLPIERITSFNQAQAVLDQADQDTLVVFDVDNTLIRPADKILQDQYNHLDPWQYSRKKLNQFIAVNTHLESALCKQTKRELVEPLVREIIATLQARGVKVLACTLWRVGPYGDIARLEKFRFAQLKELGIDFTPSFTTTHVFSHLSQHHDCYPLLYKGILFTNLCHKGKVLGAFLDTLNWQPRQVIFFDDLLDNLVSVQRELTKRNIMFSGYHYQMAQDPASTFNPVIALHQVNYLIKNHVWLNESEAQQDLGLH